MIHFRGLKYDDGLLKSPSVVTNNNNNNNLDSSGQN